MVNDAPTQQGGAIAQNLQGCRDPSTFLFESEGCSVLCATWIAASEVVHGCAEPAMGNEAALIRNRVRDCRDGSDSGKLVFVRSEKRCLAMKDI